MRFVCATTTPTVRPKRSCLLLLSAAPLLLLPLVLAACGGSLEYPTGKAEVVLRIETGGGFVPVSYNLTQLPGLTVYGDGTVIVTGPMIEIYPQPAMPNLQTATISAKDIDKILAAAKEAGLLKKGADYGLPNITDVGTTTITVNAGGQTYTSDIYALGFEQMPEGGAVDGLTAEQIKARAAIYEFAAKVGDPDTFLGTTLTWTPYAFTSLAVFSLPFDPTTETGTDEVVPNHLDWPLGDLNTLGESVLPEGYRKVVISGDDLTRLQPLLGQATQITLWKSGDREYYLYFRPLLPDENA